MELKETEQSNSAVETTDTATFAEKKHEESTWSKIAPWTLTILSTVALIVIAWFLIANVQWLKGNIVKSFGGDASLVSPNYFIAVHDVYISFIQRCLGIFIGMATIFLGISVSFYTVKKQTNLDFKSPSFGVSVATFSPGIITMIVGAVILIFTIQKVSTFSRDFQEMKIRSELKSDEPSGIKVPLPPPEHTQSDTDSQSKPGVNIPLPPSESGK